jgi:hypothetical protein
MQEDIGRPLPIRFASGGKGLKMSQHERKNRNPAASVAKQGCRQNPIYEASLEAPVA